MRFLTLFKTWHTVRTLIGLNEKWNTSVARAKCACGVLDTLGFAETKCSESKTAGRVCNIGNVKYRLPLTEILILRPDDQNLTFWLRNYFF